MSKQPKPRESKLVTRHISHITPVPFEPTRFWVASESRRGLVHLVDADYDGGWACSCEQFMCRGIECKHIEAVKDEIENLKPESRQN